MFGCRQEIYPNTTRTGESCLYARTKLVILWDFRSGLWFQEAVAKIFNTSRIPQLYCDSLSPQPPPHVPNSRKILVMVNDWTYAIETYDDNRQLLCVDTIEQHLRNVVQDVTRRIRAGEEAVPVGILSADHRDRWTEVRLVLSLGFVRRAHSI